MSLIMGCASASKKETDFYDLEVEKFSSSVKSLLTDLEFLKKEILKAVSYTHLTLPTILLV